MKRLTMSTTKCATCQKGDTIGYNKPKSLHRTKKVVKPNLQKYTDPQTKQKFILCTRCIRTLSKKSR